jgi:hypothetical protein
MTTQAGLHDVVQRPVELPVAAAVQPVSHRPAAAGRQRAGPGQGGERRVVAAPPGVGVRDDGLGGADRADAELVDQSRREGGDQLGELLLVRGQRAGRLPDRHSQAARLAASDLLLLGVVRAAPAAGDQL